MISQRSYPWLHLRKWLIPVFFFGTILFSFQGPHSLPKIYNLLKKRGLLEMEILQLMKENNRIQREIHFVDHDPEAIEKIAREDLGLIRPGEIVFRYHQRPKLTGLHQERDKTCQGY